MKFNEIQPKGQYSKTVTDENRNGKPKIHYKIYVLDKNEHEKKVLASIGGAPSKWFDDSQYKYWMKKDQKQTA